MVTLHNARGCAVMIDRGNSSGIAACRRERTTVHTREFECLGGEVYLVRECSDEIARRDRHFVPGARQAVSRRSQTLQMAREYKADETIASRHP
jgi:hypothetical protein